MLTLRATVTGLLLLLPLAAAAAEPATVARAAPAPDAAAAPAPDATPAETYYATVQVRLAEVDVVVTDRSGRRVRGLTRDDFALFEDGAAVAIESFAAIEGARLAGSDATAPAEAGAEPPSSPVTSPAPARLVAVLVDNQSLTLAGRRRLLPALRELVATGLGPDDQVIVAAQDSPGRLRVLYGPAAGGAAAATALDEAARATPAGDARLAEVNRLIFALETGANPDADAETQKLEAAMAEAEAHRTYEDIRLHARELELQARATAGAMDELVEALAGLPGRKAVLLASGGLPLHPGEALFSAWRNRYEHKDREWHIASRLDDLEGDPSRELARVAARANANRVTIYALGATQVPGMDSAERMSASLWTSREQGLAAVNLGQSLQSLAGPTGGVASLDAGDPTMLVSALRDDLDGYYSLAYTPRTREADKERRLRVEVRGEGLAARYRESLRERGSRELMVERTRAALLFGWQDNPLGVGVELGSPTAGKGKDATELPLTVTMPMSGVVLLPQGAFHEGRLTVFLAASDRGGGGSPVTEIALPVRVPNDQLLTALGQQLGYRTRLAVRAHQRLAVSVRDELANVGSTVVGDTPALDEPPPAPASTPGAGGR
jgi:VWFA-related protein